MLLRGIPIPADEFFYDNARTRDRALRHFAELTFCEATNPSR